MVEIMSRTDIIINKCFPFHLMVFIQPVLLKIIAGNIFEIELFEKKMKSELIN